MNYPVAVVLLPFPGALLIDIHIPKAPLRLPLGYEQVAPSGRGAIVEPKSVIRLLRADKPSFRHL